MNLLNMFKKKNKAPNKVNEFDKATDQKVFINVMIITFISAAIISSIINIMMFTQLSTDFTKKLLFLAISITLEGTKIFTVIKAAILRSIGIKIEQAKLLPNVKNKNGKKVPNKALRSSRKFFALYLVFAFIAIFASLGLSLSITNKAVSSTSIDEQKVSLAINTATTENAKYNKSLSELNYNKIKSDFDKIDSENDGYQLQLNTLNSKYRESEYKDDVVYNQIITLKTNIKLLKYEEKKKVYDEATSKKEDLEKKISDNDDIIAKSKLQGIDLSKIKTEAEGTANMFALIANILKFVDEGTLRFVMLIVVSLLIELTIYTTTPDISISRKLLYYFRNQLPDGINIDKLLYEFDRDLARFNGANRITSFNEQIENDVKEESCSNPEDEEIKVEQVKVEPVKIEPIKIIEPVKVEPIKVPEPVKEPEHIKVIELIKVTEPVIPVQEWPKPEPKIEQTKPIEDLKNELRNKPLLKSMSKNPALQELLASKGLANNPPAPTPAPVAKTMTKPAPIIIPQEKSSEREKPVVAEFGKPIDMVEKKGYDKNNKGLDVKMLNNLIDEV